MPDHDTFDLERVVAAQRGVYEGALAEIRDGDKQSHWMWFVFPQLAGLGHSAMAQRYAIGSPDEARAYLAHAVLGARLVECANAAIAVPRASANDIFGPPDDMKLRSCATLFAHVSPSGSPFHRLLDRFFGGHPDPATVKLLARR